MLLEHNHTTDTHTDTLKHGGMCGWMVGERMYKNESNYFNSQSAIMRERTKERKTSRQDIDKRRRKNKTVWEEIRKYWTQNKQYLETKTHGA